MPSTNYTIIPEPPSQQSKLLPGAGSLWRANVEGMVLVLRPEAYSAQRLKPVTEVLDEEPVLDATQIKLYPAARASILYLF
ncbi:MAG: hypothetical protein ACLUB2_03330 [Butyricicoccus pullicaecorum]